MKTAALLFFALLSGIFANAQTTSIVPSLGDCLLITNTISLQECDFNGVRIDSGKLQTIPIYSQYNIANQTTDYYIISFGVWDCCDSCRACDTVNCPGVETNRQKNKRLNYNSSGERRYFLLSKGSISGNSHTIYARFSPMLGTLTFPFKWRPQSGVFEKSFNLTITGGYKMLFGKRATKPDHSLGFTFGVGPSSVALNAENTDSLGTGIVVATDRAAITMSANIVYQWERLQIGLSAGKDYLFDGNKERWHYQGKTWISFGIGLSIFSESKPSTESATN